MLVACCRKKAGNNVSICRVFYVTRRYRCSCSSNFIVRWIVGDSMAYKKKLDQKLFDKLKLAVEHGMEPKKVAKFFNVSNYAMGRAKSYGFDYEKFAKSYGRKSKTKSKTVKRAVAGNGSVVDSFTELGTALGKAIVSVLNYERLK